MQTHRPILTQHRLQRFVLWALAVLAWMEAVLCGGRGVSRRRARQRERYLCVRWLTRCVGTLLIIRSAQLARLPAPQRVRNWRRGRDLRRAHFTRSMLGAALRRKLRHRDVRVCLARLAAVLRDLDAYATRLAERLSRGLTRLWRVTPPIAGDAQLPGATASLIRRSLGGGGAPALADSS